MFNGSGLAIRYWSGSDGQVLRYTVPYDLARADVPWAGIMVFGALTLVQAPPAAFERVTFGLDGTLRPNTLRDLPAGDYEYVCTGETTYACIGTVNENRRMTYEDFSWKYLEPKPGEVIDVPRPSILFIAEGANSIGDAPRVIHAMTRDVSVEFKDHGRVIWAARYGSLD